MRRRQTKQNKVCWWSLVFASAAFIPCSNANAGGGWGPPGGYPPQYPPPAHPQQGQPPMGQVSKGWRSWCVKGIGIF